MAKDVSAIATLIFAADITAASTSATEIYVAKGFDSVTAYEAIQDGCIRGIGVTVETVIGGSFSYVFTVNVAGVATNVTVTLGAAATTGYAAFGNDIAPVKAGDAIECTLLQSANGSADDPDNTLVYVLYQLGESNI